MRKADAEDPEDGDEGNVTETCAALSKRPKSVKHLKVRDAPASHLPDWRTDFRDATVRFA